MKKLKVMTVVGTRPEIIRLACVLKKLDASPADRSEPMPHRRLSDFSHPGRETFCTKVGTELRVHKPAAQ